MEEIIRTIIEQPTYLLVLGTLWVVIMISVPIIKALGGLEAEKIGIQAGVFAQVLVVVAITIQYLPLSNAILITLGVPILGWIAEFMGSTTGFPFSPYSYTSRLQPQIGGVPILVPLAWLMMMGPSWSIASTIVSSFFPGVPLVPSYLLFSLLSAGAMTAWDFYLDTQMVAWNFWVWKKPGGYFGIPWQNFAGWFGVSFVISLVLGTQNYSSPLGPLIIIYTLTWILEFIAQFFFWNLKGSALVGFLVMGAFALTGLLAHYF